MAILQMWCLSTIWLEMRHFIRSVSDHGKYGTKVKLSTVSIHSCIVSAVSVVAMATGVKNLKKTGKMDIFVIFVILKCHLPSVNTPTGFSMVSRNFLHLLLINSCQLYMTNLFWV